MLSNFEFSKPAFFLNLNVDKISLKWLNLEEQNFKVGRYLEVGSYNLWDTGKYSMASLVKDYMDGNMVVIQPESSATDAAKLMLKNRIGSLIVKNDATYLGILTEGDISRKVIAMEIAPTEISVKEIMSKDILAVDSRSTMREAFLEMNKRKIRHIAVTDNGRYIGVLSIKDFANYYSNGLVKQTGK